MISFSASSGLFQPLTFTTCRVRGPCSVRRSDGSDRARRPERRRRSSTWRSASKPCSQARPESSSRYRLRLPSRARQRHGNGKRYRSSAGRASEHTRQPGHRRRRSSAECSHSCRIVHRRADEAVNKQGTRLFVHFILDSVAELAGISTITLKSRGRSRPAVTRARPISQLLYLELEKQPVDLNGPTSRGEILECNRLISQAVERFSDYVKRSRLETMCSRTRSSSVPVISTCTKPASRRRSAQRG